MQKYLCSKLAWQRLVPFCSALFEQGYFFDWSTTDWFCVRVLDPTILRHGFPAAEAMATPAQGIANWCKAKQLWQRRASLVSFRHAAKDRQYHSRIRQVIEVLVLEDQRFIQTGIGWVLADLSKPYPEAAEALFRKYLSQLSREVIDRHTKHLDAHKELKQLKREQLLSVS